MANNNKDNMFDADSLLSLLDEYQKEKEKSTDTKNVSTETFRGKDTIHESEKDAISAESVLDELSKGPKKHVVEYDINDYDPKIYSDQQLKEIKIGIDHMLQVDEYANVELSGRQMREIRYGLERGLDVSKYKNKYFKERQMKEIRIGLQDNLDVSSYARLMYSATDMHNKRNQLFKEKYSENMDSLSYDYEDKDTGIHIYVEPGLMEAGIVINKPLPEKFTRYDLKKLMEAYDITEGYREALIPQNLSNLPRGVKIPIMFGKEPVPGKDGYFEYLFNVEDGNRPSINEDGSVDYSPERFYKFVKRGETIVTFHPTTIGSSGITVTGMEVKGSLGVDPEPLNSEDLIVSRDKSYYMAKKDGFASLVNGQVRIMDNLVFNEDVTYYNGKINFDGTVQIKGSVRDRAEINATGDIVISGHVESAVLVAGGDIVITGGVNADEGGSCVAKGNITAGFFENANVVAGGNVETGYILNSMVVAEGYVKTKGKKALICGGSVIGREGVYAGTIGSQAGTKTIVEVGGITEKENEEYTKLVNARHTIDEEIEKIQNAMAQIIQKLGEHQVKKDESYIKLLKIIADKKKSKDELTSNIKLLDVKRVHRSTIQVEVVKEIFENVAFNINGNKLLTKEKANRAVVKSVGRSVVVEKPE